MNPALKQKKRHLCLKKPNQNTKQNQKNESIYGACLEKKPKHLPALGVEGERPNEQYIQSACKKKQETTPMT